MLIDIQPEKVLSEVLHLFPLRVVLFKDRPKDRRRQKEEGRGGRERVEKEERERSF